MRILFIKQKKTVSFKNRNFTKISKCNLKFGSIGFFFFTFFRFEYYYINFLKKFLKFYFQIKYLNLKKFLFWIKLSLNYPITKKSKNSRMGKGKGGFLRWTINLKKNFIFLEFKNLFFLKYFIFEKFFRFFFKNKIFYIEQKKM